MKNQAKSPIEIAHDLANDVANCMYDLAEGDEIRADDMYNDPDIMSDMIGDRLFEACYFMKNDEDKILAWEVSDCILKIGHPALVQAITDFKKRHELC